MSVAAVVGERDNEDRKTGSSQTTRLSQYGPTAAFGLGGLKMAYYGNVHVQQCVDTNSDLKGRACLYSLFCCQGPLEIGSAGLF